jgi:uncharacterized protein (DUF1330 family)
MAAYIIADVEITNPAQYEEYRKWSSAAIAAHGVKTLVRGGTIRLLEGRAPGRVVVLEFTDRIKAQAFYDSAEYAKARAARVGAANMNMFIVDGA